MTLRVWLWTALIACIGMQAPGDPWSSGVDGRVFDLVKQPQAETLVGIVALFDAKGQRVTKATPSFTRTDRDGLWNLGDLQPSVYLIFAWQPGPGETDPEGEALASLAATIAAGGMTGTGRQALAIVDLREHSRHSGVDLHFSEFSDHGVELTGRLLGPRLTDQLAYEVQLMVRWSDETETRFLALADDEGRFRFRGLPHGCIYHRFVYARPTGTTPLAQDVVRLGSETLEQHITLPLHQVRRLRATGQGLSWKPGEFPALTHWGGDGSSGSGYVFAAEGMDVLVNERGVVYRATTEGFASPYVAVLPTDDAGDIVLELTPDTRPEVRLYDEYGRPYRTYGLKLGTEDTANFENPYPIVPFTTEPGSPTYDRIPFGRYFAQVIDNPGHRDEWRVTFTFEVTEPKNLIAVPLSERRYTFRDKAEDR